MSDSRMRRGDPPLRNIEEESIGFHGDPRATGSGGEQVDMRAVLESIQRVSAQVEHMNQRMGRLEVSQGALNTRNRQEFHGGSFSVL